MSTNLHIYGLIGFVSQPLIDLPKLTSRAVNHPIINCLSTRDKRPHFMAQGEMPPEKSTPM
jgi:hypothetical protein